MVQIRLMASLISLKCFLTLSPQPFVSAKSSMQLPCLDFLGFYLVKGDNH